MPSKWSMRVERSYVDANKIGRLGAIPLPELPEGVAPQLPSSVEEGASEARCLACANARRRPPCAREHRFAGSNGAELWSSSTHATADRLLALFSTTSRSVRAGVPDQGEGRARERARAGRCLAHGSRPRHRSASTGRWRCGCSSRARPSCRASLRSCRSAPATTIWRATTTDRYSGTRRTRKAQEPCESVDSSSENNVASADVSAAESASELRVRGACSSLGRSSRFQRLATDVLADR